MKERSARKRRMQPADRSLPIPRINRKIEAFKRRLMIGQKVTLLAVTEKVAHAVARVASEQRLSERYVWGTVKFGRKMHARLLGILEREAARRGPLRPA